MNDHTDDAYWTAWNNLTPDQQLAHIKLSPTVVTTIDASLTANGYDLPPDRDSANLPPKYQVHDRWKTDQALYWLAHLWLRTHDVPVSLLSQVVINRALVTGVGEIQTTPAYQRLIPTTYGQSILYR